MTEEFGSYHVYERLGSGGMASVHRAQLAGGGAPLALKRLLPQLSQFPEFVESFLAEARLAQQLHHPNIAATYDYGTVDDTYFIAMELVRGPTVSQVAQACVTAGHDLPLPISLAVLVQLCDALDYAHGRGIVHRDVTPSNIIVSTTGAAKLIDFGIAKATSSEIRTKTGFIKGKFAYVAPEYTRGKRDRVDHRVDLWAAGVIAHELMTGRRLFQVDSDMETLQRVQTLPLEPPSKWNRKVPAILDEIVMTALARDPDERWQRASAMRTAFAHVAQQLPTHLQVSMWVEHMVGGAPHAAETSAVSIEIALIEETMVKAARDLSLRDRARRPARVDRTVMWGVLAALVALALGLAIAHLAI